jgi:hypothetical protein
VIVHRVWVTDDFDGMHAWPNAPEHRAYLRNLHRHLFHVRVGVDVKHDDREVEFHDLLFQLGTDIAALDVKNLGSCEQIAAELAERMSLRHPKRRVEVDVSEDGECGANVVYVP